MCFKDIRFLILLQHHINLSTTKTLLVNSFYTQLINPVIKASFFWNRLSQLPPNIGIFVNKHGILWEPCGDLGLSHGNIAGLIRGSGSSNPRVIIYDLCWIQVKIIEDTEQYACKGQKGGYSKDSRLHYVAIVVDEEHVVVPVAFV